MPTSFVWSSWDIMSAESELRATTFLADVFWFVFVAGGCWVVAVLQASKRKLNNIVRIDEMQRLYMFLNVDAKTPRRQDAKKRKKWRVSGII